MKNQSVKTTFATHEAVVLTGFTKHMLDYLARDGIYAPSSENVGGRGLRRSYTYSDVVLLRALRELCSNRGRIRHLKEALLAFRHEFGPIKPGQRIAKQLFVQGNELCVRSGAEAGRQLRSGQMVFFFMVDLATISEELARCFVFDANGDGFKLSATVARKAEQERQRAWAPIKARRAVI